MTGAQTKQRILEVGCGSGNHSVTISKGFLRDDGLLVSCDFSPEMVRKMKQRYETFVKPELMEVQIDASTDYPGNSSLVVDEATLIGNSSSKRVYGCVADNMRLPFPSDFFEAYISNLSLMLVEEPER